MAKDKNGKFIVLISTLASVGLIVEDIVMGWEFWMPVVVLAGILSLWAVNLTEGISEDIREYFYLGYDVVLLFVYCVHKTSFFDAGIAIILGMATFSVLNKVRMINVFLAEYFIILFIHFLNLPGGRSYLLDKLDISKTFLHISIVVLVYIITVRSINERLYDEEENKKRDELMMINDNSMEDFLSNISHEFRTPVNVVNGMSDLLIKRGTGSEAEAIKNAGVRLAHEIEDIQDYTECRRQDVFLEEDDYMSTSLINDVVTTFRMNDSAGKLEMVVDLDPATPLMMRGDISKLHKIFRHLLDNAFKFTEEGGIYVRMYAENTDYGANLCIEVSDTGIGMEWTAVSAIKEGMFQVNKQRNRNAGGIGLGLYIVYGFAHRMGGFVKIESERHNGTTVRVTVPQKVVDPSPCLRLKEGFKGTALFHVRPDKYRVPKMREFYRNMASTLAGGIHVSLYAAETLYDVVKLKDKLDAGYIFMGQEEYEENRAYFDGLSREGTVVAVSADPGVELDKDSKVVIMPKPLYAYPIIRVFNEGQNAAGADSGETHERRVFNGVRALIVDDEPMNLVVATYLFRDYEMEIDTAESGKEAIKKFRENSYDIVFMDHMMPEMDGVEAMKKIKYEASAMGRHAVVVALTANVVSGAREMFIEEGFDGFIAKPINTADFERVMAHVLPESYTGKGGERS